MHGNALCAAPTYRSHLLVHLPQLLFLDSVRILPGDVHEARESMQVHLQPLRAMAVQQTCGPLEATCS